MFQVVSRWFEVVDDELKLRAWKVLFFPKNTKGLGLKVCKYPTAREFGGTSVRGWIWNGPYQALLDNVMD